MKRLFAALALGTSTLAAGSADAAWTISTIATTPPNGYGEVGPDFALARSGTSDTRYHIVYEWLTYQDFTYQSWYVTGKYRTPWTTPQEVSLRGQGPRIAMGGFGATPLFAYDTRSILGVLSVKYAYPAVTPGGFSYFASEPVAEIGGPTELAVQPGSVVFTNGYELFHAEQGSPWTLFEVPGATPLPRQHPSMSSYASGGDVIAFSETNKLYVFSGVPRRYSLVKAGSAAHDITYTDIDVDVDDTVRVLFNDQFRVRTASGTWAGLTFATQPIAGRASLATFEDSLGGIQVGAAFGNQGGLWFTKIDGFANATTSVDASVSVGNVDVVHTHDGHFAIVYFDATNKALKLAVGP